jgi:hypothetical protein
MTPRPLSRRAVAATLTASTLGFSFRSKLASVGYYAAICRTYGNPALQVLQEAANAQFG